MQLVKRRAGHRAAAVVPKSNRHPIGGVIGVGEVQKLIEGPGVAHAGGFGLLQQP